MPRQTSTFLYFLFASCTPFNDTTLFTIMDLSLDNFHFDQNMRGDERRNPRHLPSSSRRSTQGIHAVNVEESFATFKGYRKVRPYVRSSAQKLKWTLDLHQCFMDAVELLGGKHKATPKKIIQCMNRDGITIAHVKSHLQMLRSGRINEKGMSNGDIFSVANQFQHDSGFCLKNLPSIEQQADLLKEAVDVLNELRLRKCRLIRGATKAETLQRRSFQRHEGCEVDHEHQQNIETFAFVPRTPPHDYEFEETSMTPVWERAQHVNTVECSTSRYRNDEEPLELNLTMATGASSRGHHGSSFINGNHHCQLT